MLPDNFNCWLFCSMVDCPRLPQAQCKSIRICCHGDQAGHMTNVALYVTVVNIHTLLSDLDVCTSGLLCSRSFSTPGSR